MTTILIRGERLSATVRVDRGAKITSLRDADGREWLAQQRASAGKGPGLPFVDSEMSGWDECAPTIDACVVDGRAVPDHGDLWDQPFELAADGETFTAVGAALQIEFTRRITPTPRGLRLEYSATALAQPTPFLWAAHPQFSAPAGTRVELEGDVERIVDVLAEPALEVPWTAAAATIDTLAPGRCRKLYVSPEQPPRSARLIRPGYPALRMRWSEACPYVGLWFDAGAFAHEPVIAIEPATAYYDDLARASLNGTAPILLPGTPLRWWVELEAE